MVFTANVELITKINKLKHGILFISLKHQQLSIEKRSSMLCLLCMHIQGVISSVTGKQRVGAYKPVMAHSNCQEAFATHIGHWMMTCVLILKGYLSFIWHSTWPCWRQQTYITYTLCEKGIIESSSYTTLLLFST